MSGIETEWWLAKRRIADKVVARVATGLKHSEITPIMQLYMQAETIKQQQCLGNTANEYAWMRYGE